MKHINHRNWSNFVVCSRGGGVVVESSYRTEGKYKLVNNKNKFHNYEKS